MDLNWTAHLANDPEAKAKFEEAIVHCTAALGRLEQITLQKKQEVTRLENSLNSYDNPGWSHKQAFLNGKRAAYDEYLQLLTL